MDGPKLKRFPDGSLRYVPPKMNGRERKRLRNYADAQEGRD